jgi:hypothetical protein
MIIGNLIFMFTSSVLDRVIWGNKEEEEEYTHNKTKRLIIKK